MLAFLAAHYHGRHLDIEFAQLVLSNVAHRLTVAHLQAVATKGQAQKRHILAPDRRGTVSWPASAGSQQEANMKDDDWDARVKAKLKAETDAHLKEVAGCVDQHGEEYLDDEPHLGLALRGATILRMYETLSRKS